jgi:hypothetical protein
LTLQVRERPKNPAILSEILQTVRQLEREGKEATFNTVLSELSAKGILEFHRTLRKYLDLLVIGKLLIVNYEKTVQPNIREKQVYRIAQGNQAIIEAGEIALLAHGLNWDIPSPLSLTAKTDLQGLALATISEKKVYASLEDAIVQSLSLLAKLHPERASEIIVFSTALLATQNVNFNYLLKRAKEHRVAGEVIGILLEIDTTLASSHPNVEDFRTLYELRKRYYNTRTPLLKSIQAFERANGQVKPKNVVSSNEVVEYAGKQLGLRG